ncbi:MAG: anthranilate phosphoribosyltransferase [Candidatus Berkiellales bacterium]
MLSPNLSHVLEKLSQGKSLTLKQSHSQFSLMASGQYSSIEIAALLVALKTKGETPNEISGAVQAMRQAAKPFPNALKLKKNYTIVDCVGTGGDGQQTLNISTAVSIILACTDIKVAKHGNRAISSQCGSADLLANVGVKLDVSPKVAEQLLLDLNFCFLFAPLYHPAARFATDVRTTLKTKTIFNLLGPLLNPVQPDYQLVGVYDPNLCAPLAKVFKMLGTRRALVVHGSGLDEMAIHGPTTGSLLMDGEISDFRLVPEEVGLSTYPLETLQGGDPETNTQQFLKLLQGKGSLAYQTSVALNAGTLLWLVGQTSSLRAGVNLVQDLLQSDQGYQRLMQIKEMSHA